MAVFRNRFGRAIVYENNDQPEPSLETAPATNMCEGLIRKDQDRAQLRDQLIDGAGSKPAAPAGASYFPGLRDRVRKAGKPSARK